MPRTKSSFSKQALLRNAAVLVAVIACTTPFLMSHNAQAMNPVAQTAVPEVDYDLQRPTLTDLIRAVKPAVVSIGVEKVRLTSQPQGQMTPFGAPDDFFFRFFGRPQGHYQQAPRIVGQGSGFIIAPDGFIVTNNHVVEDADKITVIFEDGTRHPAKLIGTDKKTDLAVVKIESDSPLPYVQFGDSDKAEVGNWVVAIGNPFGFGGSATAGIISARGRDLQSDTYVDFLQIDAPINSGNSGGPVFDTHGKVIGINTAIYSPNGGNVGLGFAIPSADAIGIIDELRDSGHVTHGWLGVQIQNIDEDLAASLNLKQAGGAIVADVVEDSPAALGGIQAGDVIESIDDQQVSDAKSLSRLVALADLKHKSQIDVIRDGKRKKLQVQLAASDTESESATPLASNGDLGLQLAPLDADTRQALGLGRSVNGVVVLSVAPDSDAASKGIRRGDVIERVNQRTVKSTDDVTSALANAKHANRDSIAILVQRGDTKRYVSLSLA